MSEENLWDNPQIQTTINQMDPQTRFHYKKLGEALYNTIDYEDPFKTQILESAAQINLLLRDGMKINLLTENEKKICEDIYGKDYLNKFQE